MTERGTKRKTTEVELLTQDDIETEENKFKKEYLDLLCDDPVCVTLRTNRLGSGGGYDIADKYNPKTIYQDVVTVLTLKQKINLIVAADFLNDLDCDGDRTKTGKERYGVCERIRSYKGETDPDDYVMSKMPITYNIVKYLLAQSRPEYKKIAINLGRFQKYFDSQNKEAIEDGTAPYAFGPIDITSMVKREVANAKYFHDNLLRWPVKVMEEVIPVYSGIGHSIVLIEPFLSHIREENQEPIEFPFFMSTSFAIETAASFATNHTDGKENIILQINLSPGMPLTLINGILESGEREILLNSFTVFKYISKTLNQRISVKSGNYVKNTNTYTIYELEIVDVNNLKPEEYKSLIDEVTPILISQLTSLDAENHQPATQSEMTQEEDDEDDGGGKMGYAGGKKSKKKINKLKPRKNNKTKNRRNNRTRTRTKIRTQNRKRNRKTNKKN